MKYRPEIDGLRAVAVIPVILFHAGFAYFRGGFVGVDVFFVISGYLITTIIVTDLEQGRFSLVNFYERRARRILPALFLVMLVCLPFAWLWILPANLKDFSQSMVAVSVYSSNFLFWTETGYWGGVNELKPLLHTWSLAVEEQYYILFPLFLMLIWRLRQRWVVSAVLLIAGLSLAFAQWGSYNIPVAAFFLLPMRAWEIAIGAVLALCTIYWKSTLNIFLFNRRLNEALGITGLILIGYAVFAFDEHVPFPGVYALIPTVGTALIILCASPTTVVGRLLGTKVLVGIGLVSYSAYLWHQPLFAFARHRSLTEPDTMLLSGLALLTFLLAYLSWRFVERPFRNRELIGRKALFSFAAIGSAAFIGIGVAGHVTDGFSTRANNSGIQAITLDEKLQRNYGLSPTCGELTLSSDCRTSEEPEILVWGDSYAMHLVDGILASNPDAKIIQMTMSVCGPFFDIAPVTPNYSVRWAEGCLEFSEQVRDWLEANHTVRYAVLSSPFNQYLSEDAKVLFRRGGVEAANFELIKAEFESTLHQLVALGVSPIVFSRPPANDIDLGHCLAMAAWSGESLDQCNFGVTEMSQQTLDNYRLMEAIAATYPVVRLDSLICDSLHCFTHLDSTFVFRDTGHLSIEGSAKLGQTSDFYRMIVGESALTAISE